MKKLFRNMSLLLVVLMIFNTFSFSFAASNNNNVNVKVNKKSDDGTTKIEEGVITLEVDNETLTIEYLETFRGNKKVTELKYGDTIEKIETDLESDIFSITKNGVKKDFNKNEVIEKTRSVMGNMLANADLASVRSYFGTPYSDKLVASKSFSYNGATEVARVWEYYDWEPDEYNSFYFGAFTAVSVILGLLTMGVSTVLKLIAAISVVIGGVLVIKDALTIEYNSYRQDWNKWGIVDDDSTCYYHYHTGRTKYTEFWEFSTQQAPHIEVLSDFAGPNFYSNTDILNTTIANYKAEH